jgi:hypothetical protein
MDGKQFDVGAFHSAAWETLKAYERLQGPRKTRGHDTNVEIWNIVQRLVPAEPFNNADCLPPAAWYKGKPVKIADEWGDSAHFLIVTWLWRYALEILCDAAIRLPGRPAMAFPSLSSLQTDAPRAIGRWLKNAPENIGDAILKRASFPAIGNPKDVYSRLEAEHDRAMLTAPKPKKRRWPWRRERHEEWERWERKGLGVGEIRDKHRQVHGELVKENTISTALRRLKQRRQNIS